MQLLAMGQITTQPAFPVANGQVKIIFDSKLESRLGKYSEDLYAHTGVGIEGGANWQHVIGGWGENAAQPKLTYIGDGVYELMVAPNINDFYSVTSGQKVINMSFVFRNSAGNKQTNDLLVPVYQSGLNLDLQFPVANAILETGKPYTFSAVVSSSATLKIYLDNNLLQTTIGDTVEKQVQFDVPGDHKVLVTAENGEGMIVADSTYICVLDSQLTGALPLGAKKGISYPDNQSVRLVLFAPEKSYVFVLGDFNDWKPMNSYQMKKDGDYYWIDIAGLQSGKEYVFQYFIDGELRIADPYTEKISDPGYDSYISSTTYPGLIAYPAGKTEQIASVFQPGQQPYMWEVDNFEIPNNKKLVIYEMLIRDFTEAHSYQAVIDKLDYLADLRINVLELMPINEFEGNNSWGYNPSFYFAPDKYYGPKNDLKRLVDECHKRGIAVVIDMVLNHSYRQSPLVRMYWDNFNNRPAPNNPWYNINSNFQNPDAQWGFDFNHESTDTKELVDSINSCWLNEYRVDGFRFDFTKGFSNTTYPPSSWGSNYDAGRIENLKRMANEIWERKPGSLVICEHLSDNAEESELAAHGLMLWGNINHNYGEAAMGYVQGSNSDLSWGIYKQRGWNKPNLVSYQESHDEERLTFKCLQWGNAVGAYDTKLLTTSLDRMELNAVFHIPLPGPKMIWQFGEFGYDYSINTCDDGVTISDNCRLAEKPIRWDYKNNQDRLDLFNVFASLNFLKQNYEEFSNPTNFSYSLSKAQKEYKLTFGTYHVVAIGNFALEEAAMPVSFPTTGTWNDYFGRNTFNVTGETMNITLKPGEYRLFSTRFLQHPTIETVDVKHKKFSNSLELFPNPAVTQLTIMGIMLEKVEILTLSGATISIILFTEAVNQPVVNVGKLNPGVYLLRTISKSGEVEVGKFIKK
jgi:1,4-alpha-glucan branching enzyme